MLHVRVVSPQEETERLVAVLAASSGVRNLVVLKDAVQRPGGDAVQFDLQNQSANPVLRELRRLNLDRRGSITVGEVHVEITGPPTAQAAPAVLAAGAPSQDGDGIDRGSGSSR